ncbi:unnamed protein product [Pleuronectes platessa]|uniref:Uncharacterized protein n=1 Tax=Pleuronectes platessa TaxID=8262 RepID=A0A9N7U1C4_PLEPL|nr:unnamed protein product [Pleuronectes platessa]
MDKQAEVNAAVHASLDERLTALESNRPSGPEPKRKRRAQCPKLTLLGARQSVLVPDEVEFWRGTTIDMMSDEEDGSSEEISGWIVRPPSFRSQKLSDLCAKLQTRLEADPLPTVRLLRRLSSRKNAELTFCRHRLKGISTRIGRDEEEKRSSITRSDDTLTAVPQHV